jgi:O-antigen ligase
MAIPFLIVSSTRGHIFKRLFSVLLALFTVYIILETENRGGFVGISFSIIGLLLCYSWRFLPAIGFIAPVLLWLLYKTKPSYFERFADIISNGPASETFFSRFTVYGIALSLPLSTYTIGTGIGRFNTGFVSENPNLSQINAHNGWLSMLVELGMPGLAFYLLLMVCAFRHAFQVAKRGSNPYRWIGFACVCAIFGYTGLNLSIARDLFLPFYIVAGISLNLAHFDTNIHENRHTS